MINLFKKIYISNDSKNEYSVRSFDFIISNKKYYENIPLARYVDQPIKKVINEKIFNSIRYDSLEDLYLDFGTENDFWSYLFNCNLSIIMYLDYNSFCRILTNYHMTIYKNMSEFEARRLLNLNIHKNRKDKVRLTLIENDINNFNLSSKMKRRPLILDPYMGENEFKFYYNNHNKIIPLLNNDNIFYSIEHHFISYLLGNSTKEQYEVLLNKLLLIINDIKNKFIKTIIYENLENNSKNIIDDLSKTDFNDLTKLDVIDYEEVYDICFKDINSYSEAAKNKIITYLTDRKILTLHRDARHNENFKELFMNVMNLDVEEIIKSYVEGESFYLFNMLDLSEKINTLLLIYFVCLIENNVKIDRNSYLLR